MQQQQTNKHTSHAKLMKEKTKNKTKHHAWLARASTIDAAWTQTTTIVPRI